jgi:hypothetical protein
MIAPAPGCGLIIIGNCTHLEGGLPCKAPLFLRVQSFVIKISSIMFFLPWFQVGCRREWLRAKDSRYKLETEMPRFSPVFS